jgi:molybdenum cofactor cytidylyltransferase
LAVNNFHFAVVILGAGRSSRMGQPKLLLPWGPTTVLGHLICQWTDAGATQIAVVRASDDNPLPNVEHIINPAPERGMFSSIQCTADWRGWNAQLTHWIIALGDQPHLKTETLRQLVESAKSDRSAIYQPARAGRPRHPVVLPKSAFARLRSSTASDLKQFLESSSEPRRTVEIDDPGLDLDIDTPADYERAKQIAGLA